MISSMSEMIEYIEQLLDGNPPLLFKDICKGGNDCDWLAMILVTEVIKNILLNDDKMCSITLSAGDDFSEPIFDIVLSYEVEEGLVEYETSHFLLDKVVERLNSHTSRLKNIFYMYDQDGYFNHNFSIDINKADIDKDKVAKDEIVFLMDSTTVSDKYAIHLFNDLVTKYEILNEKKILEKEGGFLKDKPTNPFRV